MAIFNSKLLVYQAGYFGILEGTAGFALVEQVSSSVRPSSSPATSETPGDWHIQHIHPSGRTTGR